MLVNVHIYISTHNMFSLKILKLESFEILQSSTCTKILEISSSNHPILLWRWVQNFQCIIFRYLLLLFYSPVSLWLQYNIGANRSYWELLDTWSDALCTSSLLTMITIIIYWKCNPMISCTAFSTKTCLTVNKLFCLSVNHPFSPYHQAAMGREPNHGYGSHLIECLGIGREHFSISKRPL